MKQFKQILNLFNVQNQHLSQTNMTAPIITMIGTNSLLIENVYTLIEYEKNTIILKSDDYFITINGDNLSISFMYPNEMKLTGKINHIGFNNLYLVSKEVCMRHQQTKYIFGYTVLVVEGNGIEKVLQACIDQGYPIWDVARKEKSVYRITIFRQHVTYITNLLEIHGMTIIKVTNKGGLQFLQYIKQRKTLFIALFICTVLLFLLMNTAWKIQINGVSTHLEDKINTQ